MVKTSGSGDRLVGRRLSVAAIVVLAGCTAGQTRPGPASLEIDGVAQKYAGYTLELLPSVPRASR
jgi:hypothetical protein